MTISDQISLCLLIVSASLGFWSARLQAKSNKLQHQQNVDRNELQCLRQKLSDYNKKISTITWHDNPLVISVLVLGPRASGKSSIVELWNKSWTNIMNIPATPQWIDHSQWIDGVEKSEKKIHPDFNVECNYVKRLKLLIRDYAGEDRQRVDAIKHLSKLASKVVILFVFKVGFSNNRISFTEDNAEYFSANFVESVQKNVDRVSESVLKALVIFNKIDTLPKTWSEQKIMEELKKANSDSVFQITKLFSPDIEFYLTSADTNHGLIKLKGAIIKAFMSSNSDDIDLDNLSIHIER